MLLQRILCRNSLNANVELYNNSNCRRVLHHLKKTPTVQTQTARSFRSNARIRSNTVHGTLDALASNGGPVPNRNVIKALLFTGTFSAGCFVGATIAEYENARSLMLKRSVQRTFSWFKNIVPSEEFTYWQNLQKQIKAQWQQLTPGDRVFIPICALNLLVFALWRVPAMRLTMTKYFCSNPAAHVVCWPMLLSTFSHYSAFHIFANMFVLHSFCNVAVMTLGKEQFVAFYLSSGVVASLTSICYKALSGTSGLSIGASGAIMAILAYVCAKYPDTELSILFLPMLTFSAGTAIKVIVGVDAVGCLLGWKFFDHAAHLGGAMCGLFWAFYGSQVWDKRLPILTMYHDWRRTKP